MLLKKIWSTKESNVLLLPDDMFISTKNILKFLRNPSSYPEDNNAAGSEKLGDEFIL